MSLVMGNRSWRIMIGGAIWTVPVLYDLSIWTNANSQATDSLMQIAVFTTIASILVAIRHIWGNVRFFTQDWSIAANMMLRVFNVTLAARWLIGLNSGLCWWSVVSSWGLWVAVAELPATEVAAATDSTR